MRFVNILFEIICMFSVIFDADEHSYFQGSLNSCFIISSILWLSCFAFASKEFIDIILILSAFQTDPFQLRVRTISKYSLCIASYSRHMRTNSTDPLLNYIKQVSIDGKTLNGFQTWAAFQAYNLLSSVRNGKTFHLKWCRLQLHYLFPSYFDWITRNEMALRNHWSVE